MFGLEVCLEFKFTLLAVEYEFGLSAVQSCVSVC